MLWNLGLGFEVLGFRVWSLGCGYRADVRSKHPETQSELQRDLWNHPDVNINRPYGRQCRTVIGVYLC